MKSDLLDSTTGGNPTTPTLSSRPTPSVRILSFSLSWLPWPPPPPPPLPPPLLLEMPRIELSRCNDFSGDDGGMLQPRGLWTHLCAVGAGAQQLSSSDRRCSHARPAEIHITMWSASVWRGASRGAAARKGSPRHRTLRTLHLLHLLHLLPAEQDDGVQREGHVGTQGYLQE
ncbi:hypothetical protein FOCC_FOCC001089 [Frankliniella occidentalis]|nr:hypothetical protein FOCC_FOCC001089 [Frankliniella occidentalis]